MAFQSFAPIMEFASFTGNSVFTTFASGAAVRVYGIVVSSTGTTLVTIKTADTAADDIMHLKLAANISFMMNVPFIADRGLQIANDNGATVKVTVMRSGPGV